MKLIQKIQILKKKQKTANLNSLFFLQWNEFIGFLFRSNLNFFYKIFLLQLFVVIQWWVFIKDLKDWRLEPKILLLSFMIWRLQPDGMHWKATKRKYEQIGIQIERLAFCLTILLNIWTCDSAITALSFAPNGKTLVSYSFEDGEIKFWQTTSSFLGILGSTPHCVRTEKLSEPKGNLGEEFLFFARV